MPVQLQYTLTFRDYYEGQLLHAKRGWWPRLIAILYRFGFPVWGLLLIVAGSWLGLSSIIPRYAIAISVAAGLFLLSYPLYLHFTMKRCYLKTRTGDGSLTLDFDDSSIRSTTPGTRGEIEWSAIQTLRENEKVLLVYLAPAKMFMIPKRVCSPEQVEEIRQLFRAKAGTKES